MNEELCFCIENKDLYFEQTLVEYMNIPIFFLCKSGMKYYVVLCINIDEFDYILVNVSDLDIYKLLHGNIPMRNIFLNQSEYWEVKSGEDVYSDTVTKYEISCLDLSLLPKENAYFKALTEEIKTFIQNFDSKLLNEGQFNLCEEKTELNEITNDQFGFSKIKLNVESDLMNMEVEEPTESIDLSFKLKQEQHSKLMLNLSDEYLQSNVKECVFEKFSKSKQWINDNTIYMAA